MSSVEGSNTRKRQECHHLCDDVNRVVDGINRLSLLVPNDRVHLGGLISALGTHFRQLPAEGDCLQSNDPNLAALELGLDRYSDKLDLAALPNIAGKVCKDRRASVPSRRLIAGLLYEQGAYQEAAAAYKSLLGEVKSSEDVRDITLKLAFCHEGNHDYRLAIDLLNSESRYFEDEVSRRSWDHSLSHFHVGRYLHGSDRHGLDKGRYEDRVKALEHMQRAVDDDYFAYFSCQGLIRAELGDYLGALDTLVEKYRDAQRLEKTPNTDPERLRALRVVRNEVLFYIAHVFSCLGNYGAAETCFTEFISHFEEDGTDPDALAHGHLFSVINALRQQPLLDCDGAMLEGLESRVESNPFTLRAHPSVGKLRWRVLESLAFLVGIRRGLETGELQDADLERLVSKCPQVTKMRHPNLLLVTSDGSPIPNVLDGVPVKTVSCDDALILFRREATPSVVGLVLDASRSSEYQYLLGELSANACVLALNPEASAEGCAFYGDGHLEVASLERLDLLARFALTYEAVLREFGELNTVYTLMPCADSPAVADQQPGLHFPRLECLP